MILNLFNPFILSFQNIYLIFLNHAFILWFQLIYLIIPTHLIISTHLFYHFNPFILSFQPIYFIISTHLPYHFNPFILSFQPAYHSSQWSRGFKLSKKSIRILKQVLYSSEMHLSKATSKYKWLSDVKAKVSLVNRRLLILN